MFLVVPAKGEGAFSHFEVLPSAVEICFVNIQVFLLTGKFVFVDFYVSRQWKRLSGEGNMCSNLGKYYFFAGNASQCWEISPLLWGRFPNVGKDCSCYRKVFRTLGRTAVAVGAISQCWEAPVSSPARFPNIGICFLCNERLIFLGGTFRPCLDTGCRGR